jgi:hypothetical protein
MQKLSYEPSHSKQGHKNTQIKETPVQIHKGLNRGIYKRYVIKTV